MGTCRPVLCPKEECWLAVGNVEPAFCWRSFFFLILWPTVYCTLPMAVPLAATVPSLLPCLPCLPCQPRPTLHHLYLASLPTLRRWWTPMGPAASRFVVGLRSVVPSSGILLTFLVSFLHPSDDDPYFFSCLCPRVLSCAQTRRHCPAHPPCCRLGRSLVDERREQDHDQHRVQLL